MTTLMRLMSSSSSLLKTSGSDHLHYVESSQTFREKGIISFDTRFERWKRKIADFSLPPLKPRIKRDLSLVWIGGGGTGAEIVGASSGKPGPLGGGPSVCAELFTGISPLLRPALGRVFPGLLPTIDGHVQ